MVSASRDANRVPTVLGTLDTDGITVVPIIANPSTHHLIVDAGSSGSDFGPVSAKRDENRVTAWMGVSSADGITPVSIYATSAGRLKVML